MKRIQFFEIEDQPWLPESIRNGVTDFLRLAVLWIDLYKPFRRKLDAALSKTQTRQVVDLCSGGGAAWESLIKQLPSDSHGQTTVTFTDMYPNLPAFSRLRSLQPRQFHYVETSVPALDVPNDLQGFRTLFSSFHHFQPDQARQIVADAVRHKQGIAIAEATQRHVLLLLYMLFTPLLVLLCTPFQRPFKWSRLFWTYLIPVIPFVVMFDGIVSCLRTYTPEELRELIKGIEGMETYDWDSSVATMGPLPIGVTYLIGTPKQRPTQSGIL